VGEPGTSGCGKRGLIIAIDGPAGVGKSTVARLLALRLGYLYLDTGALYRAIAWKVRDAGLSPEDQFAITALLPKTTLAYGLWSRAISRVAGWTGHHR
jgi:cytidylate kinase